MPKPASVPALVTVAAAAVLALAARDAHACGGCFVPASERTVVTDHRMALALSREQTVLWDQIRYSGDPAEFAWVLPVRAGAKLELANDELFTALDTSTQPIVFAPNRFGGAQGCGLTGCSEMSSDESASSLGPGEVQVLGQSVVGPYETATLRATDSDALTRWLTSHAFAIPATIAPTIRAYVEEGFDFLALRLRPGCGERAMQPVRIVTKGADPTLPLRMVAAGVGPRVGITLWVIGEGRYQPQNFPSVLIDEDRLRWDRFENRSTYESLSQGLMAQNGGRTWITEYADRPQVVSRWESPWASGPSGAGRGGPSPGLADVYYGLCRSRRAPSAPAASSSSTAGNAPFTPCPRATSDAGLPAQTSPGREHDAGEHDAGEHDAGEHDAGEHDASVADDAGVDEDASTETPDAGPASGETRTPPREPEDDPYATPSASDECAYLDDLRVAFRGMSGPSIWVTRLRATLPADTLTAGDLRLEPSRPQSTVSNVHYTFYYTDEDRSAPVSGREGGSCVNAPKQHTTFGAWTLTTTLGIAAVAALRRCARRRR